MNTSHPCALALLGFIALSSVADAVTSEPSAALGAPVLPGQATPATNVVPTAPPLPDVQSTLNQPMNEPLIYTQLQVPRPNLGGEEDRAEHNRETLDKYLKILEGATGAPKATINGRANPRYQEQFSNFAGGSGQPFSSKDMSDELSSYNLTKDPKTASELAGLDCGKNSNNRLVCMVCNIMFEAGNEPKAGQLAVGQNVMTRVYSQAYPDTVCKNVYKVDTTKGKTVAQYSWVLEKKDHHLQSGEKLSQVFQAAVEALRKGPNGYTNYYAPSAMEPKNRVPPWAQGGNCAATLTWIGSQRFCSINAQPMRSTTDVARAEGLTMRADGYGSGSGGDATISR